MVLPSRGDPCGRPLASSEARVQSAQQAVGSTQTSGAGRNGTTATHTLNHETNRSGQRKMPAQAMNQGGKLLAQDLDFRWRDCDGDHPNRKGAPTNVGPPSQASLPTPDKGCARVCSCSTRQAAPALSTV